MEKLDRWTDVGPESQPRFHYVGKELENNSAQ